MQAAPDQLGPKHYNAAVATFKKALSTVPVPKDNHKGAFGAFQSVFTQGIMNRNLNTSIPECGNIAYRRLVHSLEPVKSLTIKKRNKCVVLFIDQLEK
jgi:hypothetical protein